jgi:hypothetical protein
MEDLGGAQQLRQLLQREFDGMDTNDPGCVKTPKGRSLKGIVLPTTAEI